jgi:hypothetical protein
MQKMTFSLHISADKYRRYYTGQAKAVVVVADDGRRLQFPAANLQKFVTHEGIQGRFEIVFDANHKISRFARID